MAAPPSRTLHPLEARFFNILNQIQQVLPPADPDVDAEFAYFDERAMLQQRGLMPANCAGGVRGALNLTFRAERMRQFIEGDNIADKDMVTETFLQNEIFKPRYGLGTKEYRDLTVERLKRAFSFDWVDLKMLVNDPEKAMVMSEPVAWTDLSFAVKMGVHSTLFTGAILLLGSPEQIAQYEPLASNLQVSGCFAMTEKGHGSNVRNLETIATYDASSQEFVINTPTDDACKWYIGNTLGATHGIVFAQLHIGGKNEGPHAFIVQIRDPSMQLMPGVSATDNGEKCGLNGIDNGILRFTQVRVPRTSMLNKFADVAPDGQYSSPYSSPGQRFNAMLSALILTRVALVQSTIAAMKQGLTIAIKYALSRHQFGPPNQPEISIMEYSTHQRRLMPHLAAVYGMTFTRKYLVDSWKNMTDDNRRSTEAIISGLKAYATWQTRDALQECRECCGGQGFLAENRIGLIRADTDIFVTFEGDNTVLLQQVAKDLLVQYQNKFAQSSISAALAFFNQSYLGPVMEALPPMPMTPTENYVRSYDFLRNCFLYQESKLLHTVAVRLRHKVMTKNQEGFDAWNECLDHLLTLTKCHIERIIYEQFCKAVKSCSDPSLKNILRVLCDLFALSRLERRRDWFLEHGYFSRKLSKYLRNVVQGLCKEAKDHAEPLVDAFGIHPDLIAPIAR
eukprot:GFYU01009069.1.p1 GENE.GFYU01009069.1~~GFYU01009069.1.p1  ORF type:complete len:678 (-),score=183.24 GFYU01009069.1:295-2328(-)